MSSTATIARRAIVPDPVHSEEDARRFWHHDLDELTPEKRAAEAHQLAHWLTGRIFHRVRPRVMSVWADGVNQLVDDQDWVRERISRLKAAASATRRSVA